MSSINVVHVSDLHWREESRRDMKIVLDALVEDIEFQQVAVDALIFSGDAAFSADTTDQLENAFEEFILPLASAVLVPAGNIFVCPGNHDISRSVARSQTLIENGLRSTLINAESIDRFLANQNAGEYQEALKRTLTFYEVLDLYVGEGDYSSPLHRSYIREIKGAKVGVACLNTAWRATGESDDADYGKLLLGERILDAAIDQISACDIKIAVHHHPLDWLIQADKDAVFSRIHRCFDLSCTGHLHDAYPTATQSQFGVLVNSQAPSIFQGRSRALGYQIIGIDSALREVNFDIREYVDVRRSFDAGVRSAPAGKLSFKIGEERASHCSRAEGFLRFQRERIREIVNDHLDFADFEVDDRSNSELFIIPPLSRRGVESLSESEHEGPKFKDVDLDELLDGSENLVFLGDRQSGKTSLALYIAERMVEECKAETKIPVYVDARQLKHNIYGLRRAVRSFYGNIPAGFDVEDGIKSGLFCFLIDNFDGQEDDSLQSFARLTNGFALNRWLAFGTPRTDGISKERRLKEHLPSFGRVRVRELPRKHIRKMADNWVSRGALSGEKRAVFDLVMNQLVRDGLPRTPYMVTLLLWAMHKKQRAERLNEASLLGMVIDYLLGKADFTKTALGSFDPTSKEIVLQHLAISLRESGGFADEGALVTILIDLFKRKRLSYSSVDVLNKLVGSGILSSVGGVVSFKYQCFQEYFVASAMKRDMRLFHSKMDNLQFLDYSREIELLAGLRRENDDIITAIKDELETRIPVDLEKTTFAEFAEFASRELSLSITADKMRSIRETRLSDDQVDEMMDEADRRALARGEEAVSASIDVADGNLVEAGKRRQEAAIRRDREENAIRVRPATFIAALDLLGRVVKHSEFSDYDVKGPVAKYVIGGWVKVFLRFLGELTEMVRAIDANTDKPITDAEVETVLYIFGKYVFNMMSSALNELLSSPSMSQTLLEIAAHDDIHLGEELLILFLLEDANYPEWHIEWGKRLEKPDLRGFVMETFLQRLWTIASTKSLDGDQSHQVNAIVGNIEKRLDWSKKEKSGALQGLRDATTVATYVEGG